METYHFNRRAWNESYSGRTAKVGRPKTGLSNALDAAIKYAKSEGATINVLNAVNVPIAEVSEGYVRLSTSTLAALLAEIPVARASEVSGKRSTGLPGSTAKATASPSGPARPLVSTVATLPTPRSIRAPLRTGSSVIAESARGRGAEALPPARERTTPMSALISAQDRARHLAKHLTMLGARENCLDDLVAGAMTEQGAADQEGIFVACERRASSINNQGFEGQCIFILERWGIEEGTRLIIVHAGLSE